MKKMLHKSIDTLPIWSYNQIAKENDLKYLSFEWSDVESIDPLFFVFWQKIINEYIAATAHREGNRDIYQMQHRSFELAIEYNSIQALCFVLERNFTPDYAKKLSAFGFDVDKKEDLQTVLHRARNLITKRNVIDMQIAQRMTKHGDEVTFEQILDRISQHQKIRLNPREITVKEWIAIEDNYLADLKRQSNGRD